MNFITWLENNEYDQWRSQIDNITNRDFAFSSWFPPDGRVYLPFNPTNDSVDEDVEDILKSYGYSIQDYRQGLATDKSGRIFKIGKLLEKISKQIIQDINNKLQSNQISPYKAKLETQKANEYIADFKKTFQDSPLRSDVKSGLQYEVVISNNPHDIASMSTGRDWASCMELGKGAHYKDVFCEVKKGGFIAYLIRANDKDIKKPLARILIRRFDNKKGQSIAMPEQTVYGNPIEGFQEIVNQWIESKQGKVKSGYYRRKGGEYSDTFQDKHIVINKESDIIKLLNNFEKLSKEKDNTLYGKAWNLFKEAFAAFFNSNKQWSQNLIEFVANFLKRNVKIYSSISLFIDDFIDKYPDYVDEELTQHASMYTKEKLSNKNPKFSEIYKSQLESQVLNKLDINLLNKDEGKKGQFSLNFQDVDGVNNILRSLNVLKELKEPIIQKIIKFGNDFMEKYQEELPLVYKKSPIPGREANTPHMSVLKSLMHTLYMGGADSPIVVNFYKNLLPFYDRISPNIFNISLAKLGRNGIPFLPFLQNKLKELESEDNPRYPEMHEKQKENLRYTIDSIENGTGRSDRYAFTY